MQVKVNMEAPFAFCEECALADIEREDFYEGSRIYMTMHQCKNRVICENAVKLYSKRIEDGRPV